MHIELRNWLQRTENIRRIIYLPAVFSTVIHSNHHCHKIHHNMFKVFYTEKLMRLQYEVALKTCWHFIANAISKSTVAMILFPEFPTSYICSHLICSTTDQKSFLAILLDKKCNDFSRTLLSFSWSGKKINRAFVLTKTAAPVLPDAKSGLVTKLNW